VGVVFIAAQFTYLLGGFLSDVFLNLPMSRDQETEADYIGLMLMAEACYDPRAGLEVWPRLDRAEQGMIDKMGVPGMRVPEWASTHPASLNRLERLREWMPRAEEKRWQSDCRGTVSFADQFVEALRGGWPGIGQIELPR
jgi:predicted Zn-dependent protease